MLVEYKLKNDAFTYVFEANLIYEDVNSIYLSSGEAINTLAKKELEHIEVKGDAI